MKERAIVAPCDLEGLVPSFFIKEIKLSKNVINIQNNGNNTDKGYPLFLGENLGFADTINVTYPELAALYEEQRSQFWIETEHDLSQDKLDFETCDPNMAEVMIRNLMSQWLMDSVAARSIMSLLEPFTSNNEVIDILSVWSFFEGIHARTYSFIMRQCFIDANDILERAKADSAVSYRSKVIGSVFNEMVQVGAQYTQGTLKDTKLIKKALLKTICAVYSLEAISFMGSFACTFALTETGKFQAIGNDITAICKDELLHAKFGKTLLEIMLYKEDYLPIFEEFKEEFREIFIESVKQEFSFNEYIFSEGRHVLGLNTSLLDDYDKFLAFPIFNRYGFEWPEEFGEVPKTNPLRYMEKYVQPDTIQSAAQEITLTNYRIGQVVDDTRGMEFDF